MKRVSSYLAYIPEQLNYQEVQFEGAHFVKGVYHQGRSNEPIVPYTDRDVEAGPTLAQARAIIQFWNEGIGQTSAMHYKLGRVFHDISEVFLVPMFVAVRANNARHAELAAKHAVSGMPLAAGLRSEATGRLLTPIRVDEDLGAIEVEGPNYDSLKQVAKIDVFTRAPEDGS